MKELLNEVRKIRASLEQITIILTVIADILKDKE